MERIVAEYRAEIAGAAFPRRAHPHLHPRDDMKEEKKPLSFLFWSGAVEEEDGQTAAYRYSSSVLNHLQFLSMLPKRAARLFLFCICIDLHI